MTAPAASAPVGQDPAALDAAFARILPRMRKVALLATAVLVAGFVLGRVSFFQSYLVGYLFCLSFGLGSLGLTLLHNLTGGAWGFAIKPFLSAGCRTLPLLALLFVPLLFGIDSLYEWSHAEVVAHDPLLQHKQPYLNAASFRTRAAVYFGIWILVSTLGTHLWVRFLKHRSPDRSRMLRVLSAPGIILYVLTMTFASVDWGMSLEPHWFSTIYPLQIIVGQVLATLCLVSWMAGRLSQRGGDGGLIKENHFHDLGNLTLAFVMLWAYMSFSQYLIIWSGNLPEETPWYLHRTAHGWQLLALALILFHFAMPFTLLLSRKHKRSRVALPRIALALLCMRLLDLYWVILPAFEDRSRFAVILDLSAPIALGTLWFHFYLRQLRRVPALLQEDGELVASFLKEVPAT